MTPTTTPHHTAPRHIRNIPELARPLLVNISIPNFYRIIDCEVEECPEE
jgi:hypothetical protein